jgi:cell division septation protein DedD
MSIVDKIKDLSKAKKIGIGGGAIVVIAGAIIAIVLGQNSLLANTMRLLRVEGTVNIEDTKGSSKPVIDNIRFQSGDALSTGKDGLASVGLDDTKIVTLENDSRAEFMKKGKQLELKLTQGALFFNVTQKLKDDESLDIKTSTMTAGIRGTSGIVYYDETDDYRESIIVTDGAVEISATNAKTGETKTARVEAGKMLKVYLTDDVGNSVNFEIKDVPLDELGRFSFPGLAENDELMDRISKHTGWDKNKLKEVLRGLGSITVPTQTPTPTLTPTSTPTSTPTPTPTSTSTPTPTPKPKPKSKKKTTTTPKKKNTPVPKKKSTAPSVPSGYSKYVWGAKYNGKTVYIVHQQNELFKGYYNGKWVELDQAGREISDTKVEFSYFLDNGTVYYKETKNYGTGETGQSVNNG